MKYLPIVIFFSIGLLMFTSCEEVVDPSEINLSPFNAKIVIEGNIILSQQGDEISSKGPFEVKITRTKPYFEGKNTFEAIEGAVVEVSDDYGQHELFQELEKGIYVSQHIEALEGHEYTMKVSVEGKTYTAKSTLLPLTKIDTLISGYREMGQPLYPAYYTNLLFNLHETSGDYFRIKVNRNGAPYFGENEMGYNVRYLLADGTLGLSDEVDVMIPYGFEIGDEVEAELISFDGATMLYYRSIYQQLEAGTSPMSPLPGEIKGNIQGGALGHFAALSISKMQTKIEE